MVVEPYVLSRGKGRGRAAEGAEGVKYSSGIIMWGDVPRWGDLLQPTLPLGLTADCVKMVQDAALGALVVVGRAVCLLVLSLRTMA